MQLWHLVIARFRLDRALRLRMSMLLRETSKFQTSLTQSVQCFCPQIWIWINFAESVSVIFLCHAPDWFMHGNSRNITQFFLALPDVPSRPIKCFMSIYSSGPWIDDLNVLEHTWTSSSFKDFFFVATARCGSPGLLLKLGQSMSWLGYWELDPRSAIRCGWFGMGIHPSQLRILSNFPFGIFLHVVALWDSAAGQFATW